MNHITDFVLAGVMLSSVASIVFGVLFIVEHAATPVDGRQLLWKHSTRYFGLLLSGGAMLLLVATRYGLEANASEHTNAAAAAVLFVTATAFGLTLARVVEYLKNIPEKGRAAN
jgi:drug/metabolite transporter (DMT)-like permease